MIRNWKGLSACLFTIKVFGFCQFPLPVGWADLMETLYNKVENISFSDVHYNQDKRALYDRWKEPGDNAKFRAISTTADTPMSSRFVADNNVFSGESISVGYESQGKWLKSVGASSLTVMSLYERYFPDFNREK